MNNAITVQSEYIKSLLLFAAKKDVRQYLNGICIEVGASESRLIATNGHMLGVFKVPKQGGVPMTNVIIPSESFAHVKKGIVVIDIGDAVTAGSNSRAYTVEYGGVMVNGASIDGRYPDWRRVLPQSVSGENAQFNCEYMAILGKVFALLNGRRGECPIIGYNGQSSASVSMPNDNFTGVITPVRHNAPLRGAPAWARDQYPELQ